MSGTSTASFTTAVSPAATMGRVACHSPSLRATPRQTGSVVKSWEVHTRPRMNL
jgi:enterochelin esterase-like enzyme